VSFKKAPFHTPKTSKTLLSKESNLDLKPRVKNLLLGQYVLGPCNAVMMPQLALSLRSRKSGNRLLRQFQAKFMMLGLSLPKPLRSPSLPQRSAMKNLASLVKLTKKQSPST